jgi:hypothetical protein
MLISQWIRNRTSHKFYANLLEKKKYYGNPGNVYTPVPENKLRLFVLFPRDFDLFPSCFPTKAVPTYSYIDLLLYVAHSMIRSEITAFN